MIEKNLKNPTLELDKMLQGEIFFQNSGEEEVFHQQDLVLLKPFGIVVGSDASRPFLLLKNLEEDLTLPVAVSPLEAGVTLTQGNKAAAATSPYKFTEKLIQALALDLKQCVFTQILGPVQYVRIYISGHPSVNNIKLRADEAMSLCLQLGVPIYATRAFINKSKLMRAQIEGLTDELLKNQKILMKNQTYIM